MMNSNVENMTNQNTASQSLADTDTSYTKLIIRDMHVDMFIGIYASEKQSKQPVLINLEATVENNPNWRSDSIEHVVSYETIVEKIRSLAQSGHIDLVETYAEYIAEFCLQDNRVIDVIVRIEKTEIFHDATGVGVEIKRSKS